MLNERRHTQKVTYCMILLIQDIWNKQIHRNRKQAVVTGGGGRAGGDGGWGVTAS